MNGLIERYGVRKACYQLKVDDATHSRALERRIKEEFTQYKDYTFILANCLDQEDPAHDLECRDHIGRHPETMRQVAEQTKGEVVRHMLNGLELAPGPDTKSTYTRRWKCIDCVHTS